MGEKRVCDANSYIANSENSGRTGKMFGIGQICFLQFAQTKTRWTVSPGFFLAAASDLVAACDKEKISTVISLSACLICNTLQPNIRE